MVLVVKNLPASETRVDPWIGKIPWSREWQPTPVILPGKSHVQRLAGYSPWCQRVGHNEVIKHRTLKERKIVEQEDSDE